MGNIVFSITAENVAWYGAIVATISALGTLILGILNYLNNRQKIKIDFQRNKLVRPKQNAYPYDPDKYYTCITVTNIGIRTITVNSVGFEFLGRGEKGGIMTNDIGKLPCELKESTLVMILTQQDKIKLERVKNIYVETTKKRYKKRITNIWKIIWYKFFKYRK